MEETKKYIGETGTQGLDGYAGLRIGESYTGQPQADGSIAIVLPTGRTCTVAAEQWKNWFE